MQTQKPIPRANAPQSNPLHSATIHAQLNPHCATGIAGLLDNVALLAVANTCGCQIDEKSANLLQSYIQTASLTLSRTMTALSFTLSDVLNDNATQINVAEYITPDLVANFSALVGELLPIFTELSENLISSKRPE